MMQVAKAAAGETMTRMEMRMSCILRETLKRAPTRVIMRAGMSIPCQMILGIQAGVRSIHPCIEAQAPLDTHQKSVCILAPLAGGTSVSRKEW